MTTKPTTLAARRIANFKANRRAYWSLIIFTILFVISLFAEFLANDKPVYISYRGEHYFPIFNTYYETDFNGFFATEADYRAPEVQCLIETGGVEACLDGEMPEVEIAGKIIWPPIPYSFNTIDKRANMTLSPPSREHLFGTDSERRDIFARIIYGFRISVLFAIVVTLISSTIGIFLGAVQGYFGGKLDLFMQRFIEIWQSLPMLYMMIIFGAIFTMNFYLMSFLVVAFTWTGLVGVVRAEFLRTRNFEYVRAAQAMGISDFQIMWRHVLPNAMIATITFMPFIITGAISTLTALDFLGFGLPSSYPSLGELAKQAKQELGAYWIAFAAFLTYTVMLSLMVFIFEGVRDAFDPRKTFK